jgi:hypothetical protein
MNLIGSDNEILRARVLELLRFEKAVPRPEQPAHQSQPEFRFTQAEGPSADLAEPIHAVVTINEINDRHGTGPLVKRIFKGRRNVLSIRSRDHWGFQDFADWSITINQDGKDRQDCFRSVLGVLRGRRIGSIVCVPFLADEILTSIAIKECFNAPLCVWVMDDQNVTGNLIPDSLMRECLEKASLRLVTHPELRLAYERKFSLPFHILPAVVPEHLVAVDPVPPVVGHEKRAALIGSFWDQLWFDRTCAVLTETGWKVDWFGNNKSPWLTYPEKQLERAGITPFGVIPEERLALELRNYPFVIVPAGALDPEELNKGVASLSLPGRILFAAATSHTPVLLMGSERTCGARFVRHFGIGEVVPYRSDSVNTAIARLTDKEIQQRMRQNAAGIAAGFSDRGVVEWLAWSIEMGRPADTRFEAVFSGYNAESIIHGE